MGRGAREAWVILLMMPKLNSPSSVTRSIVPLIASLLAVGAPIFSVDNVGAGAGLARDIPKRVMSSSSREGEPPHAVQLAGRDILKCQIVSLEGEWDGVSLGREWDGLHVRARADSSRTNRSGRSQVSLAGVASWCCVGRSTRRAYTGSKMDASPTPCA